MWIAELAETTFIEDVWKCNVKYTNSETREERFRDFKTTRLTDAIYQRKVAETIARFNSKDDDTTTIKVGDVISPIISEPAPDVNQVRIDRFRAKYGELRQLQILKADGLFLDSREVDDAAIATLQKELNELSKPNKREVYGI